MSSESYRRDLGASLDRLYENALDWQHLPWLHSSTFASISCRDSGEWGFVADVGLADGGGDIVLELTLDRSTATWVSRTAEGPGAGTSIVTVAAETGERSSRVDVSFHVPARLGSHYVELYTRLYDEDESMMIGRQQYLDRAFGAEIRCPHRGGPLVECDGVLQCPWHGYRYDKATGQCLDDPRLHCRTPSA
jgi:hypothetical protein